MSAAVVTTMKMVIECECHGHGHHHEHEGSVGSYLATAATRVRNPGYMIFTLRSLSIMKIWHWGTGKRKRNGHQELAIFQRCSSL